MGILDDLTAIWLTEIRARITIEFLRRVKGWVMPPKEFVETGTVYLEFGDTGEVVYSDTEPVEIDRCFDGMDFECTASYDAMEMVRAGVLDQGMINAAILKRDGYLDIDNALCEKEIYGISKV